MLTLSQLVNNAKQHDKPKDSHNKDDMINQNKTNRDKAQDSNKPSQAKYCLRKTSLQID